jgi:hypothetical protein
MPFNNWFRRKSEDVPDQLPWERHPSIYEHVLAHIQPGVRGLTPNGKKLPDEPPPDPNKVNWAPGAMDGVVSHHVSKGAEQGDMLVRQIVAYCQSPTAVNKLAVYESFKSDSVIAVIDDVLAQISKMKGLDAKRLYELAHSFVTSASDRGPVKIGVGMLGRFRQPGDLDLFRALGRHEEFTLFCAVALSNSAQNPETELWELAQQVDGWGRIHIVERLAKTADPRIKDWMLRDGFRNSVMNEYLAYTCATASGLATALQSEQVTDELLQGAGEIIGALVSQGGPAQGIDDYEEAPIALEAYLRQIATRAATLAHYLTIRAIRDYLERGGDIAASASGFWPDELRQQLREQCDEILNRSQWRSIVQRELDSSDEQAFHYACKAAELIGIDTWPYHWRRINEKPTDPGRWYNVTHACTQAHIAELLALAERTLPLDKLGSGPASETGLGGSYALNSLDFIAQELRRFPGFGTKFIETALRSPVIRTRNMAVKALETWGKPCWPARMHDVLGQAAAREPEPKVAKNMRRVLEGQPME